MQKYLARLKTCLGIGALLVLTAACHSKAPPPPSAEDIDAAKQDAARDLAQARAEASKDVKSAAKVAGSNSREVTLAKATASYDVAMVKADGDHKIASEKCATLAAPMTQPCKDQADAEYESAKAAARKLRQARDQ